MFIKVIVKPKVGRLSSKVLGNDGGGYYSCVLPQECIVVGVIKDGVPCVVKSEALSPIESMICAGMISMDNVAEMEYRGQGSSVSLLVTDFHEMIEGQKWSDMRKLANDILGTCVPFFDVIGNGEYYVAGAAGKLALVVTNVDTLGSVNTYDPVSSIQIKAGIPTICTHVEETTSTLMVYGFRQI